MVAPVRTELRTPRLLLRTWTPDDAEPMAVINRDREVTRFLNRPTAPGDVAGFLAMVQDHWDQHGFGLFAVESAEAHAAGEFIGFVGLAYPTFLPEVADRLELGWRLARSAWGRGLPTEAARAVRDFAFADVGCPEAISIIHPANTRSRRVAEKLGMSVERQVHNPVIDTFVDVWRLRPPEGAPSGARDADSRVTGPERITQQT